jgi:diguanylate cyclase (GGDEF)-like protein
VSFAQTPRHVPPRALALALASLAVPVAAAFAFPEWIGEERGMLIWMTALIPPFLLAYYRGLRGVAVALAAGMAVLALTQAVLQVSGLATPNWPILLAIIAAYAGICIALAILAELLHREREAAVRLALVDPLTSLPNRRQAELTLDTQFASAIRSGGGLVVVLFDLDHFKNVNDQHGHDAGDEVLRAFAESLKRHTRRMNLSARFGGEEFIAVLGDGDLDGAKLFANRVRDEIRAARFPWGSVTVSAGAAAYEDGMGSYEVLVAAADRALYTAKEAGRDRLVTAKPTVRPKTAPVAVPAVPTVPTAPTAPAAILVVDDDPDIRTWAVRVLRKAGYRVEETDNADEAIRRFRDSAQTIDLLVTDVMMPKMNGLTLADHISALRPQLRVVYMSGYIQRTEPWAGLPGAVVGLVAKPIRAPEFLATIQDVLSRSPQTV